MFNFADILFYALVLLVLVIGVYILYGKLKPGAISDEKMERAMKLAFDVVYMIEQTLIGATPQDKKLAARDKLKRLLDEAKINLSDDILNMLIEGAVFIVNTEILGKIEKY